MSRNHIHFAIGYPEDKEVISGMRQTCEIFIEIDLELASRNGIKFLISHNKVVLSSGIQGVISPIFFKKVYEQTSEGRKLIFTNENQEELKNQLTFKNIFILDFEMNNDKTPLEPMEVIEFPIVLIDSQQGKVIPEKTFHYYVKPTVHPILTDFIIDLTGIQQEQVDKGITIEQAIEQFYEWFKENGFNEEESCFVTCGEFDLKALKRECTFKKIEYQSILKKYMNIKTLVAMEQRIEQKFGMPEMLKMYNLQLDGKHHSGIDDAKNIAKVYLELLKTGFIPLKSFAKTLTQLINQLIQNQRKFE